MHAIVLEMFAVLENAKTQLHVNILHVVKGQGGEQIHLIKSNRQ